MNIQTVVVVGQNLFFRLFPLKRRQHKIHTLADAPNLLVFPIRKTVRPYPPKRKHVSLYLGNIFLRFAVNDFPKLKSNIKAKNMVAEKSK